MEKIFFFTVLKLFFYLNAHSNMHLQVTYLVKSVIFWWYSATLDNVDISGASVANLGAPFSTFHISCSCRVILASDLGNEIWPWAERSRSHVEGHIDEDILDASRLGVESWDTVTDTLLSNFEICVEEGSDLSLSEASRSIADAVVV